MNVFHCKYLRPSYTDLADVTSTSSTSDAAGPNSGVTFPTGRQHSGLYAREGRSKFFLVVRAGIDKDDGGSVFGCGGVEHAGHDYGGFVAGWRYVGVD